MRLDQLFSTFPPYPTFVSGIRRAPKRKNYLTEEEKTKAIQNALRYIPTNWQEALIPEFYEELETMGRIYGYRFRPQGAICPKPVNEYEGKTLEGKAIQLMIDNNLSFDIALYPYELITYGETGQVFQNWMQYCLTKAYLIHMNDHQTLHLHSGHPMGLFPSQPTAPRLMITNGLMIGAYDNPNEFARAQQLGVASYGQMTAGGFMYIGPQGIVHGTYNTLLNAARLKLNIQDNLAGVLFVSSGLGGMSGAQGKAMKIAGGVGIIAEVDESRVKTRHDQGWIDLYSDNIETVYRAALDALEKQRPAAIGYLGNVVDVLTYAIEQNIKIDLLSDQTSCHNVYDGGYCPVGLTFKELRDALKANDPTLKTTIHEGLRKHYDAIKQLTQKGTYFFDYGNAFMQSLFDSGITEIAKNSQNPQEGFIWPSYVEDIMGPLLFDYGYGPFRWVCLSMLDSDLKKTDEAAMACIDPNRCFQDKDNYEWIKNAENHHLVVGSKARILYSDAPGRMRIALKFNQMVREKIVGPIMLGRDHHDTGGTDSPLRETANIKDGSNIMADMATHSFAGDAARGMTLVALHNGGGVGVSKSINGGFGLVLDGSERVDTIIQDALLFDVLNGVSRRAWAKNPNAIETMQTTSFDNLEVTLPFVSNPLTIEKNKKPWTNKE